MNSILSEKSREYDYGCEIVNGKIGPIAKKLTAKYEELRHIDISKILFIVNHKSGAGKKRIILAKTRRIPDKWCDILFQSSDCLYSYIIEFIGKATACFDENQMTALVYRELLMIGPEGDILTPDTNDWWRIIVGLGRCWFYPDSTCPNLLDADIDWKKLLNDGE